MADTFDVIKVKEGDNGQRWHKPIGTLIMNETNGVLYLNMFDGEFRVYLRKSKHEHNDDGVVDDE